MADPVYQISITLTLEAKTGLGWMHDINVNLTNINFLWRWQIRSKHSQYWSIKSKLDKGQVQTVHKQEKTKFTNKNNHTQKSEEEKNFHDFEK